MKSPLPYHGGKNQLANRLWAIAQSRPHLHRVEPFAGGLSFTLATEPEGYSEVVNDLHGGIANFWSVLRDPVQFEHMKRILEATPFGHHAWDEEVIECLPHMRAAHLFVRCRMSMAGRMKDFTPLSRNRTRRGMNEQVSGWLTAIEGLPEVHNRLKRVVVLNRPALEVIQREDGPNTLFYCDPPYLDTTRVSPLLYEYEMSAAEHETLLRSLLLLKGAFMLSGYNSTLYTAYAGMGGWHRTDFDVAVHSGSGDTKRRAVECLWTNFKPKIAASESLSLAA